MVAVSQWKGMIYNVDIEFKYSINMNLFKDSLFICEITTHHYFQNI